MTLPGTPPPPDDDDFYYDYDKCQNRLIKTQQNLAECVKALRDIKGQALVAERPWILSRADAALRKIRS